MKQYSLLKVVVDALDDVKGQDICVYDTTKKTSAFDHVVIASGTSNRQTRALANAVEKAVKEASGKVVGVEGTETGEWVLVDCGSIVCHCMQPNIRKYYDLEELWGPDALDVNALFAKAASQAEEEAPAKAKATPKKTATKKATTKKATEKKPAAKKSTTKKAATKKVDAKKTAVKKAPAKKAPAKKTAAKKTVAKKTTAKTS